MDFSAIYCIYNTETRKRYVGSAINLRKRWTLHRHYLTRGTHHSVRLQRSWNKYGAKAFRLDVLERVSDPSLLLEREQVWLDHFRAYESRFGYNIVGTAGSTLGRPTGAATRAKISAANLGRKHTGEQLKNKQDAARRPEAIARLKAIVRSDDTRIKISLAKGGAGKILTTADVSAALAAYETGNTSFKRLASEYGVSYATMRSALSGAFAKAARQRPAVRDPNSTARQGGRIAPSLSPDAVANIKALCASGVRQSEVAKQFSTSTATISRIVNRKLKCYSAD